MRDLVAEWTSPQGVEDLTGWVDDVLVARGEHRRGPLDPIRVRFWSAVFRLDTDHGRRWVKLGNPGQAFEGALLRQLGALVPDEVLAPLAVDETAGRWLLPDGGPTLRDAGAESVADRAALLVQVADLQQRTAGERHRLTAVPALPQADTTPYVVALVDRLAALPPDDPQSVTAEQVARWRRGLDALDAAVARLIALGLPDTLQPATSTPTTPASRSTRAVPRGCSTSATPCGAIRSACCTCRCARPSGPGSPTRSPRATPSPRSPAPTRPVAGRPSRPGRAAPAARRRRPGRRHPPGRLLGAAARPRRPGVGPPARAAPRGLGAAGVPDLGSGWVVRAARDDPARAGLASGR
ncbi:hypothetical protein [Lapillicoccus jejuensis]|uniref:Aminoglycoside phosphotransferase domain-containing protein n=1 Tax=Lapillicoccus jejuensis TaxID=402171 RepID=A0A542DX55_9MICO|nr:hypothetical protein [Lapillicoccus jejuensis]TQJ07671.1 hypothetical protein FB458_0739 [Lapillicoccus jejuensis]